MRQKILVLAGTRPEAIKLAPVVRELKSHPERFRVRLCCSGQHREMMHQALADFELTPDFDLQVMRPGQSLAGLSAALFGAVDRLLTEEKPDWVVVQGDTTTVMIGVLCAFYRRIRVAHVEAGLRSFDKQAPFPEEVNRRVAGVVADLHFAPTETARANLLREGVAEDQVLVTGNTVIDALLWMTEKVRKRPPQLPPPVHAALAANRRVVLITGHRRESFGPGFRQICLAIRELAERHRDCTFIYPVHLNPNVRAPVFKILGGTDGVILTQPLTYKPFVYLMDQAHLVLTDSGGIQEEAPSLGKPVLVMREVTERPEGVEAGTARLVGTDSNTIITTVERLLRDLNEYRSMARKANPYGDGTAAQRIAAALTAPGKWKSSPQSN